MRMLQWQEEPYVPEDPWALRKTFVRVAFRRLREQLLRAGRGPELQAIVRAIGAKNFDSILQKAGVAEVLLAYRPGGEAEVVELLGREAAIAGRHPVEGAVWDGSQLVCLEGGDVRDVSIELRGGVRYADDGPYVREGVPGDSILEGPFVPFDEGERSRVRDRVERALDLIAQVPSPTRHYVTHGLRVVFARKFGDGSRVHSNSRTGRIGWIVLGNPHLEACSVGQIVEMILHESLHHDLALREYRAPFMSEESPTRNSSVVSPWTGAKLVEKNLSHAILVWFSLASFFGRFGDRDELAAFTERRLAFYRSGFARGRLADLFGSPEHLHPSYVALLDRIDELARDWTA